MSLLCGCYLSFCEEDAIKIAERESRNGNHIVIIGNDGHPEVEGIKGWCDGSVTVLGNAAEAERFEAEKGQKLCIVSQTTFNYNKFKDLVEILEKKRYDISVLNTICSATEERQSEARKIGPAGYHDRHRRKPQFQYPEAL